MRTWHTAIQWVHVENNQGSTGVRTAQATYNALVADPVRVRIIFTGV
jgi:hypothetical protein